VDNASVDGSVEFVEKNFPEVAIVRNQENLFFAKGNNIGYQRSNGEYVLLLNNDTEIQSDSIDNLVEYLDFHTDVAAACGQLLNRDGTIQKGFNFKRLPSYWIIVSDILLLHRIPILRKIYDNHLCMNADYSLTQFVEQPAASYLMVRRSVIERLGLFDEKMYYYYNDVDFCKKVKNAGLSIAYVPLAKVYHLQNASQRLVASKEWTFHYYSNLLSYVKKYYGTIGTLFIRPLLLIAAFERLIVLLTLRVVSREKFTKVHSIGSLKSMKDAMLSLWILISLFVSKVE